MFRFSFGSRKPNSGNPIDLPSVPMKDLPTKEAFRSAKSAGELPWTSTLSVADWLSLRKLSLNPVGQVMGSSIYHMGWFRTSQANFLGFNGYSGVGYSGGMGWSRSSFEIRETTQALYDARSLAMERMRQEAVQLGANAVVDARLLHNKFESIEGAVEFVCIGTAVRVQGIAPLASPLICSVPGEDLLRLLAAGSFPMGLAVGASYYYLATNYSDRWQETSFYNQEMQHFTNGVYDVRHFAQKRLREDAHHMGADGVVGVDYTFRVEEFSAKVSQGSEEEVEDHILEFVIFGTAISRSKTYESTLGAARSVVDLRQETRRKS